MIRKRGADTVGSRPNSGGRKPPLPEHRFALINIQEVDESAKISERNVEEEELSKGTLTEEEPH
jgi:hypothetical protein